MVGPGRAVFLRTPPELRPDVDEHVVGEPARLEVALEGQQALRGEAEPRGEIAGLVGVRVVGAGRAQCDEAQRQPGREQRREAGEPLRKRVVALGIDDRGS